MYEGAPNQPREDRFWEIVAKYQGSRSLLYSSDGDPPLSSSGATSTPRATIFPACGCSAALANRSIPKRGCVYHEHIGGGRCPIVDTWWQTETGAIMIAPLPGAVPTKPGSATKPLPGIAAEVVDKQGNPVPREHGWLPRDQAPVAQHDGAPSTADDERFKTTYWNNYPGIYFTADGARQDDDGYIWVMGRVDDVLNVSGHRLSTMEVESALGITRRSRKRL